MLAARTAILRARTVVKAERYRRQGLRAQLAFRRFLRLYNKYSPDQPRDERGRWTETDRGHDQDESEFDLVANGAFVGQRARIGDPAIDAVTEILEGKVVEAINNVGPGAGRDYGLAVHSEFAKLVREANIPNIQIEKTWFEGEMGGASVLGSIRTDVSMRSATDGKPVAAWDLKTGSAVLKESRADEIRAQLRAGPDIPVIELHVIRGSMFKEHHLTAGAAHVLT